MASPREVPYLSHGAGDDFRDALTGLGSDATIETGVRIFHPENVRIGDNCYVGHGAFIDGYHDGFVNVGAGTWVGPFVYLHGAGGIEIGTSVGIGPRVTILSSEHTAAGDGAVLHTPLRCAPVTVEDGADIGASAVILPGVVIGEGAVVGAGAVVTRDVPPMTVAAGNPARVLKRRA